MGLVRVGREVVQLPGVAVVVLGQGLEPVQGLVVARPVEQVLEADRHVEVLVNGEGLTVVEVLDEFVAGCSYHPHGVVHGDLVQVVTGVHRLWWGVWVRGVGLEQGQEGVTSEVDTARLVEDVILWVGDVEPLQHSRHNVQ